MAFPKYHGIHLALNSWIENLQVERLAADPVIDANSAAGRVWYNTTDKVLRFHTLDTDGTTIIARDVADQASLNALQTTLEGQIGTLTDLSTTDKTNLVAAINELQTALAAAQAELDATQAGAGLAADGSYVAPTGTNYLDASTSLADADAKLDTQVKTVADAAAATQTEVDAIEAGAGLNSDGTYTAPAASNYLTAATSLADADSKLDAQIKTVADSVSTNNGNNTTKLNALQSELDATQTGAGLAADGTYVAPVGSNYIDAASSLADAESKLDAAIKTVADEAAANAADKVAKSGDSMSGNLAMQGNLVTGLGAPTTATDAANKNYVDSLISGLSWKAPVVAVLADHTAATGLVANDRVADTTDNKIYVYDGAAFDAGTALANGDAFFDKTDETGYVFNGTAITQFTGTGQITAGVGLNKIGNVLEVNLGAGISQLPTDEVGIDVKPDGGLMLTVDGATDSTDTAAQLSVRLDGTTLAKSASGVKVADTVIADIAAKASQTEVDATQAGAGLGADGSYTAPAGSNYLTAATSLADADVKLDSELKSAEDRIQTLETNAGAGASALKTSINGQRYTFASGAAALSYTVVHNLNSSFLQFQIMVQGDDGLFHNDIVPVTEVDANTLQIDLTEARNIKIAVSALDQLA